MGVGKSTSSIIASLESGAKKILIICPATLKINWQREIENYSDRKTLIVEGRKWGSTFDYYIINYDIIKNYHTIDEPEIGEERNNKILNEKFDLAIVDEAHYISNTTAQRTKLINDILKNIPKVWLLTGTPMT
jgi:SNF2 family DNA or RNA helicase